jgi:hypothetical protein
MGEERFVPSAILQAALDKLSPQQAAGVIRIVEAELRGVSIERLFVGDDAMCARSTYFAKNRGGWKHKPEFKAAEDLARQEYRGWRLGNVVNDGTDAIKLMVPLATNEMKRQLVGDVDAIPVLQSVVLNSDYTLRQRQSAVSSLAAIATDETTRVLIDLVPQVAGKLLESVVSALGDTAAGTNAGRRAVMNSTLDRASELTAIKGGEDGSIDEEIRQMMGELGKRRNDPTPIVGEE